MTSIGAYLRELRERRGVPLAEIARITRVAPRYLEALEADAFHALPPPVFTRGFIRAYCQALAEAPEEALACYDARPGAPPPPAARPATSASARTGGEPRSRSAVVASLILLVILGMALFTVALLLQPRERMERSAGEVRRDPFASPPPIAPAASEPEAGQSSGTPAAPPAAPSPTRVPSASAVPAQPAAAVPSTAAAPAVPQAPTAARPPAAAPPAGAAASAPTATETRPTAASPPRPAPGPVTSPPAAPTVAAPAQVASTRSPVEMLAGGVASPYHLVARTSEATWIRVRTEDGRSSEETMPAGEMREWVSDRPFVLTIGNAGGVSLELNGRALPPLGAKGTVIPRLVLPPEAR